jgi:hypothetical protein
MSEELTGEDGAAEPDHVNAGADADVEADTDAAGAADATVEDDARVPLSALRERIEAERATSAESEAATDEAPLSELARESQSSSEREHSELFEEVDVGDIDTEAVWGAVVEEGTPPEEALDDLQDTAAGEADAAEQTAVDEHVVDKREYCQRCAFFTDPPDVGCTNEGTEILELVDSDRFRVRNCPKVDAEAELSSVGEE